MNTPEKTCVICDSPLYGRADKTTCSDACRVRLHRQRQNEDFQETDEQDNDPSAGHDAPLDLPWLRQQPIISTERDYLNRMGGVEDHKDATEYNRTKEAALAIEMHVSYANVVEHFLRNEQKRLPMRRLSEMLRATRKAYESYKIHPQLTQDGSVAQKCHKDLREIAIILQETYHEALDSWIGSTSQYELTRKWRRQLNERRLG